MSEDYEAPIPKKTEVSFAPKPDCPLCEGTGTQREGGKNVLCECVIRQHLIHYFTPTYLNGVSYPNQYSKFPLDKMRQDFLFEGVPEKKFRDFVRSFLAKSIKDIDHPDRWMKHQTISGFYLMEVKFNNIEGVTLTKLMSSPDFLILNLSPTSDPPNSMYQCVLETLCKGRKDKGKLTWINSEQSIAESAVQRTLFTRVFTVCS